MIHSSEFNSIDMMPNQPTEKAQSGSRDRVAGNAYEKQSLVHSNLVRERLSGEPKLRYLHAFMRDPRLGNNGCKKRQMLASGVVVLERRNYSWHRREWNVNHQPWEGADMTLGYAVIMNYLDPDAIRSLLGLGIDIRVFQAHMDGCEQHYTGEWKPNSMTAPPYLRTDQHQSNFVCFDYRRRYTVKNEQDFAAFDSSRKERCRLLRSHHMARSADALFEHERCTIAWTPKGNQEGSQGMFLIGSKFLHQH